MSYVAASRDRRAHDPFAPHPRAPRTPVAPPPPDPAPAPAPAAPVAGLDTMRKPDLIALAEQRGLDTTGTRPQLIARIRQAT